MPSRKRGHFLWALCREKVRQRRLSAARWHACRTGKKTKARAAPFEKENPKSAPPSSRVCHTRPSWFQDGIGLTLDGPLGLSSEPGAPWKQLRPLLSTTPIPDQK